MIKISKICKNYGNLQVLKNLSLDFSENEIVSIIGPSGSGKSTLLRTINGLEKIDSGLISIDDINIDYSEKSINNLRKKIGIVFQNFNLFPHLTVIENIVLSPIKVLKIDKDKATKHAIDLLKKVGLLDKKNSYPNQLSGGQKQRVAIARALAMKPKYLLYDEPTSALDPEMISEVLDVIKSVSETGITTIIVTHEINFAKKISDKIIFMDDGEILLSAEPNFFFEKCNNKRINSFINKINI